MDKKVYWTGVEYNYSEKSDDYKNLKGGFIYAFIYAFDVREALEKLSKGLEQENLLPKEIEFISPYDEDMEWEEENQTAHYYELFKEANKSDEVIFDDFYAYETE